MTPHRLTLSFDQEIWRGWRTGVRSRYVSGMPVDDANSARTSASWVSDLQLSHDGLDAARTGACAFSSVGGLAAGQREGRFEA